MNDSQKLDRILFLLEKKHRIPVNQQNGNRDRQKDDLLTLFGKLSCLIGAKKKDYKFPNAILPETDQWGTDTYNPAVVPLSILKNRCSMMASFKKDSANAFEETLKLCEDELAVSALGVARRNGQPLLEGSELRVVWSRDEAIKYGVLGKLDDPEPMIDERPRRGFAPLGMRWATDDKYDFSVVPREPASVIADTEDEDEEVPL